MSDDLSGGDSTPKLTTASIKDITKAINLFFSTFKTPDVTVTADILQLASDGNLALGNAPKVQSTSGRNFLVSNTAVGGGASAAAGINIESQSGTSILSLTTRSQTNGIYYTDLNYSASVAVLEVWDPATSSWKIRITDGTNRYDALTAFNNGDVGVGHGSANLAKLTVGAVGSAQTNEIFVASNTTTFEGLFAGAYDSRSGAKVDFNSQASASTVSSWRISHDSNDGGQGRLSFRFAGVQNSRVGLSYSEKFALTNSGLFLNGANRSVGGAPRYMQIENTGQASISLVCDRNDNNGPVLAFGKTRGTVVGGTTISQDGDSLGDINWSSSNGTTLDAQSALIRGITSGAVTSTSTPGALTFGTTPVGGTSPVEAFRVTNQQNVAIGGSTSDVAKVVITKGVSYTAGESALYMQSSNPASIPVMINGSSSGTTQISGGSALASGGARGGGIDLVGGGASVNPGYVILRAGTNADGNPSPSVLSVTPNGFVGINTLNPGNRLHVVGNTGERNRVLVEAYAELPGFTMRRANGTAAAPTQIKAGDQVGFINIHSYGNTAYLANATVSFWAEADHTDSGAATTISVGPTGSSGPSSTNSTNFKSTGKVGVNTYNPSALFTICDPTTSGANGLEVDVSSSVAQFRAFDRTALNYTQMAYGGSSHTFSIGQAQGTAAIVGYWSSTGLTVGDSFTAGGSGNTAVDGKLIVSTVAGATGLFIQSGEHYAGLKIKASLANTANGSCDYFDITTRPGASGVSANADYPLIRLENALSTTTPNLYLQPNGTGKVVVGSNTTTGSTNVFNVVTPTGTGGVGVSGGTVAVSRADMSVSRSGTTENPNAGFGSSIQLVNGTNNNNVLLQQYNGGLQVFSTNGTWSQNLLITKDGTAVFWPNGTPGSLLANGNTAESVSVKGRTAGGNDYCYYAEAQTSSGVAYGMRFYSTTAAATVGSITFNGSSVAYNQTSDRRLKRNIVDAPSAKNLIRNIQIRSLEFITDGSHYTWSTVAQELNTVAPFAVHMGSDTETIGNSPGEVWGVDYLKLVPATIKAQQETMDDVDGLKIQLANAEAEISNLSQELNDLKALVQSLINKSN